MSPDQLVRHAADHQVRMLRPTAAQVIAAARLGNVRARGPTADLGESAGR